MASSDSVSVGALAALRRAAAKARRRAFDTVGSVPIVVDGRVVWQMEDGTLLDEPEQAPEGVRKRFTSADPYSEGASAAMQRAAEKARRRGFDTVGSVAIVVDGAVVWQKEDGTLLDAPERAP